MTSSEWPASIKPPEGAQQFGDVVEMQAGGRFVEQKQRAAGGAAPRALAAPAACACAPLAHRVLGQMAGELQPLRFAARERRYGLAQPQIIEPHFGERRKAQADLGVGREKPPALRRP